MKAKNNKHIIDVVPLTKIPLTSHQSFSYLSETEIPAGTLVSIPLFRRNLEGIVLGVRKDFPRFNAGIELKKIDKIIEEKFLTPDQIELAKVISDYYISPLGVVMKNFVPKRVKPRIRNQELGIKKRKNIILTKEQNDSVEKISKTNCKLKIVNCKFLLYGPSGSGKTEVYINAISQIADRNPQLQFLILIPEKTLTPQAIERYGAYFKSEEIAVISSNISKGQLYSTWQKIKSGEIKIVIGTRMAIFAPFRNLGLIVIDEEQDMSYKQWDMNPRYDARKVAEKLAEIHKCKIVRGSATPSVESYWRALNKEYGLIELPKLNLKELGIRNYELGKTNTTIVDMKRERWDKNYTSISKKLKSEIAYALKYNQQIILFINRQGMSSFSICEACKTVLRCPKCDRALIYEKGGFYQCNHCNYKTDIFPKCKKCGGINFKNIGLGTQKVEKEILNFFPLAKILVADSANSKKKNFQEEIYSKFSKGEADILIGTQMISKGWDLPRVSLIGIIDADNLLSLPDFFAEEKAFQSIVQVSGRANRPGAKFPGVVVIQTFQPENKIVQLSAENNFQNFFEKVVEERKALNLPPFGSIVKLVFQDYNFQRVEKEVSDAFEKLESILGVKLSEPHIPLVPKIRGRFRKQIIIKFPKNKIPEKLEKELKKLGSGWIIDRDPISII
ncbi:MAG TPA: primosomal protein N' [Candidatus Moranbacteria bacterium]|nr:primosomal protein N' [Candidatus Moranbacteria bacterium]